MSSENNLISVAFNQENWTAIQQIITEYCGQRGSDWITWGEFVNSQMSSSIVNARKQLYSQPDSNQAQNSEPNSSRKGYSLLFPIDDEKSKEPERTTAILGAQKFQEMYQQNEAFLGKKAFEIRRTITDIGARVKPMELYIIFKSIWATPYLIKFLDFIDASRLAYQLFEAAKQVKINYDLGLFDNSIGDMSVVNDILSIGTPIAEDIIDLSILYEIWLWRYDRDDDTDVLNEGMDALAQSEEEGWETYHDEIGPYIEQ